MKPSLYLVTGALCAVLISTTASAREASEQESAYLAAYHEVHEQLAEDDLDGTKSAAKELQEKAKAAKQDSIAKHAGELAASDSLETARKHFKPISEESIKMAEGIDGQFVFHCPMAKADWLQTEKDEVVNPYMGKKMLKCGSMKKS